MEKLKNLWDDNDWLKAIIIIILYLGFAFYLGQFWILLTIIASGIWLFLSRHKSNSKRVLPASILLLSIVTLFIPNPLNHNASQKLKDIPSGLIEIPDIALNNKETAQAYLDKAGIKSTFISVSSEDSGIDPGKVSYDDGQPGVKTFHSSDYKMKDSDDLEESYIKKGETLIVKVADKNLTPASSSNSAPASSTKESAKQDASKSNTSNSTSKKDSNLSESEKDQKILDDYTNKIIAATPGLVAEYNSEAASNNSGIDGLATISNAKITKLAEISNEGITKMAEVMLSTGSGSQDTYTAFAGKLTDVYSSEAEKITDAYMASAQ